MPTVVDTTSARPKGPMGPAKVEVQGKNLSVKMKTGGKSYLFPLSDLGDALPDARRFKTGDYFVSISSREDKLWSVRPLVGTYFVKFKRFKRADSKTDIPTFERKQRQADFGEGPVNIDEHKMTAVMEIQSGDNAGLSLTASLVYSNGPTSERSYGMLDDGAGKMKFKGRSKDVQRTVAFLTSAGYSLDNDEVEFSDNMLPAIEEILLERDRTFMVTLNAKGWPDTFAPAPDALSATRSRPTGASKTAKKVAAKKRKK
jgi:hypothetical protein